MLNEDEKKVIKLLIKKEINEVSEEGNTILKIHPNTIFLEGEQDYNEFLQNIIKKL